jgi:hypothetical protein
MMIATLVERKSNTLSDVSLTIAKNALDRFQVFDRFHSQRMRPASKDTQHLAAYRRNHYFVPVCTRDY